MLGPVGALHAVNGLARGGYASFSVAGATGALEAAWLRSAWKLLTET